MSDTAQDRQQLDHLQRAALALKRLRAKLDALEYAKTEPIAIIGMGCRLPGTTANVCGPADFWHLLRTGGDAISEVPPDRWDVDRYYDASADAPGKMYTRWGGFLRDIDRFDAPLFGIAPREAMSMDPQQRLLLEVVWEALEHAGQAPDGLKKTSTGIFIGIGIGDYANMQTRPEHVTTIDAYTGTGSGFCFASGRLSYILGVHGPSLSVDTACSSSLVAIHLACQSLRSQECRIALAGGVNAMLAPEAMLFLAKSRALSPTGRCRTFDAAADGFVRGEGCGVLVLKRLGDAIADGDTIHAVIRGSAINHDGPSSGLTVPNGHAQQSLLRQALEQAQIQPSQVDYVEAHGTGTNLGDPIELRALGAVLGEGRDRPLVVGSVKTNIGHLEAAAGVTGVIKAVLALQHGEIPPHLHFREPSPHIPWDELPLTIPTAPTPWPARSGAQRIAGVSSFGLSGTNAHVLIAEAPPRDEPELEGSESPQILSLSAKSEAALLALAERYEQLLAANPSLPLADVCFTANTGRAYLAHHLAVIGTSTAQLRSRLADFIAGQETPGLLSGQTHTPRRPKIAFLCTGQGAQYVNMGRELYATEPVFREALDRCDAIVSAQLGTSLLAVLYAETPAASIDDTLYTQPTLVALEYALAELWRSWGIVPAVVFGHSVGEYAAACIAGIFSLEDGLRLVVERARLMQALPLDGAMLAVSASEERVRAAIATHTQDLAIAALNGPQHIVISGRRPAVEAVAAHFAAEGIKTRSLTVSHAFHSPLMQPMLADFARVARSIRYTTPKIEVITNLTGDVDAARMATPDYWIDHVLQPVQFAAGVKTLQRRGYDICIELGPRPVLLGMARQDLTAETDDHAPWLWLPSLRQQRADREQMLESLAALHTHGVRVDWSGFYRNQRRHKLALPTYPFQQQRYWSATASPALPARNADRLPGQRVYSPAFTRGEIQFEVMIDGQAHDLVQYDSATKLAAVSSAAYIEMALAAGAAALNAGQMLVEELAIGQALVFPGDTTQTLQLLLTPESPSTYGFQVLSLASATEAVPAWTCHATGRLRQAGPTPLAHDTLAALRARIGEETAIEVVDHGDVSSDTAQTLIEQSFRREGEILFRVALPNMPAASTKQYWLHPLLLDACFQQIGMAPGADDEHRYVLERLERMTWTGRAQHRIWCYARQGQSPAAHVQIFDETGTPLAELTGLVLRQATPDDRLPELHGRWQRWLHHTTWQQTTLASSQPQAVHGSWLILADRGGTGQALAELFRARGEHCTLVYAGSAYTKQAADEYAIDPLSPSDMQQIVAAWASHERGPCSGVVHLWSLDVPFDPDMSAPTLRQAQTLGCGSALYLTQALTGCEWSAAPRLWLITRGSQPVAPSEPLQPLQMPLWGLGYVIALEHPELRCACLDLDPHISQEDAALLRGELRMADDEARIAYRQGARYAARLSRSIPDAAQLPAATLTMPISADSTYVITGGLGGLGLTVARWMVEQGAGALVLLGRRAPTTETQATIAALEQAGARVVVAQVDVADGAALAAVLEQIPTTLPPLRGIVHAAAVIDDGLLRQLSWEQFERVMQPKAAGAWNLHLLTRNLPLDFFVCFSSIASVFGSPGQANYAAANAFLDGLAHYRRALGLPATSINWGPWAGSGMELGNERRRAAQGLGMIAPDAGLEALGWLLQHQATQATVLSVDWQQFLGQIPSGGLRAFVGPLLPASADRAVRQPTMREHLAAVPMRERQPWLTEQVRAVIAQVLGAAAPEQIARREGLFEQGLDSLMALEVKNRLEAYSGYGLPQTFVFDYPMVDAIVEYFSSNLFPDLFQPEMPTASGAAHVHDLADLSDDEAEALLLAELDKMNR